MNGKCHICQEQTSIKYCSLCRHWFCDGCRDRWTDRGLAALKEFVGGRKAGCCGPQAGARAGGGGRDGGRAHRGRFA